MKSLVRSLVLMSAAAVVCFSASSAQAHGGFGYGCGYGCYAPVYTPVYTPVIVPTYNYYPTYSYGYGGYGCW